MKERRKKENITVVVIVLIVAIFYTTMTFLMQDMNLPMGMAAFLELFVSIHMTAFVITPASLIISPNDNKRIILTLFISRAILLIALDILVSTSVAIIDFISVFLGLFLVIFLGSQKKSIREEEQETLVPRICSYCGSALDPEDNNCPSCGAPYAESEVQKN